MGKRRSRPRTGWLGRMKIVDEWEHWKKGTLLRLFLSYTIFARCGSSLTAWRLGVGWESWGDGGGRG